MSMLWWMKNTNLNYVMNSKILRPSLTLDPVNLVVIIKLGVNLSSKLFMIHDLWIGFSLL